MALISQILGHSSYNWALKWFSTSLVAVALLGEPIGSTILAYILFDEGLTWLKFIREDQDFQVFLNAAGF